jgi:hypothetical protein
MKAELSRIEKAVTHAKRNTVGSPLATKKGGEVTVDEPSYV